MSEDRREALEAALDQAEEGTLEAPVEKEIEVNDDPIQAEEIPEESNNRDEKGRFKSNAEETSSQDNTDQESELVAEASDANEEPEIKRPTTWKKE
jgi:hypothetical protein